MRGFSTSSGLISNGNISLFCSRVCVSRVSMSRSSPLRALYKQVRFLLHAYLISISPVSCLAYFCFVRSAQISIAVMTPPPTTLKAPHTYTVPYYTHVRRLAEGRKRLTRTTTPSSPTESLPLIRGSVDENKRQQKIRVDDRALPPAWPAF